MRPSPAPANRVATVRASILLIALLVPHGPARAQEFTRLSGWPLVIPTQGATVSERPEGMFVHVAASDPLGGLTAELRTADETLLAPGAHAGTRTAIGPIRWMAPEALAAPKFDALSITGSGRSRLGAPWSLRLGHQGNGEFDPNGPALYLATMELDGVAVAASEVLLRLTSGNGGSLHEAKGTAGSNVLYGSTSTPTSTTWVVVPVATTSVSTKDLHDLTASSFSTLRVQVQFEVGTRLRFFDPLDPATPIEITVTDSDATLQMDQELDPILGGSLSMVGVNVVDATAGPLTLALQSATVSSTGQEIRPEEGTLADLWLDADEAAVLQLTPPARGLVRMTTPMAACVEGIALHPAGAGADQPALPLRVDGSLSHFALHEVDAEGAPLRTTTVSVGYDVVAGALRIGVDSSDPAVACQLSLVGESGEHVVNLPLGDASVAIGTGPAPGGNELPTLLVSGPDEFGVIAFGFRLAQLSLVEGDFGEVSNVASCEVRVLTPPTSGVARIVESSMALEWGAPALLAAAKEWVKPCPSHVICSARGLGRSDVALFGERGVWVGNVGRGALSGASGEEYPGGVRLGCVDGDRASIEFAVPPDPVLPFGAAWQVDVHFAQIVGGFGRSFARPGPGGLEIGFDFSRLVGSPTVQVQRFDAEGILIETTNVAHDEVAFVVEGPVVSFHVDAPSGADSVEFAWGLGELVAAESMSSALGRHAPVLAGRIEATVLLPIPSGLGFMDVRVDGPPMVALLVGDEAIGVSAPPAPPYADAVRVANVAPNPFNPRTEIRLDLARQGRLVVRVVDARGRTVRRLLDDSLSAGSHVVVWDGKDDTGAEVASGVYLIRAESDPGIAVHRKIALIR